MFLLNSPSRTITRCPDPIALSVNRFIKNATVNSGREGRICERPKMIGWSLSQAGAPEMGISEEGASSLLHGTALTDNTLVCLLFTAGRPPDTDDAWRSGSVGSMVSKRSHGERRVRASGEEYGTYRAWMIRGRIED